MINYNEILEQLDKIYNTFSRGLIKTTAGIYKKHILNRISGQNKISNKEKHSDIVYDDNIFTRAAINFIDKHSDFYTNKRQKNDKIEQSFVKVTQAINQAKQDSIYGTLSTFNSLFNNNKLTLLSYPLSGCAADYVNALSCGITQYIDIYSNISGIYVSDIYNSGDSPLNYETHKTLNVIEGNKYIIYVNTPGHPVALQTVPEIYEISKLFTSGLTINGGGPALTNGNFEWDIPNNNNMPKTVYYVCTDHISEGGTINILKPLKVRAMPIRPEQTVTEDSVQIPLKYGGLSRIDALSNRATTCWDLDNFKYTAYDFWGKSGLNVTFPFYDTTGPYNTYFTWLTEPSNPSSLFPSFEYKNVDTCYLSNQNNQAYTVKIGQYEDPVLSEYNSPGDMDPFIRSTKWPARQVNLSINPYFSGRLSEHGTTGTIGILDNYNSIVCSTTGTSFRNISLVDIRANCYGVSPSASTLEGPTPLGQTLLTYSRCSYVLEIVDENNNPVDLPSSTMAQNIVSGTGYYAVTYLSLLVQNRQWHKDAGHAFINITAGNFGSGVEILDINEIGNQDPDYGPIPWLMGYGGATNMGDRTYRVGSVRGQYIAPYTSQGCIVQFAPNEIVDLDINGLSVGMYVRGPFVPIGTKITAIYAAAGNCPAYVVISNNIDDNYELGFNNVYYNYEFYNLGTINSINIEFPLRSNKGKLFEYALTNGLNVVTPIFWSFAFLQYWNDVTYPGGFYGVIYERNRYTSFAPSQFFSQDGFAYSDWEFNYQPSTVDPTCRDFSADPCYSGDILDYSGVPYLYYGRPQPDQGYGGALSAALDYGSADAYGDEDRLPNGYIDPSVEIFKNHRADARPSTLWAGNANVGFYHPDAIGNSSDNPFYVYTPHGFAHFLITLKSRLSAVQPLEWITEDECGDMTINHTKTVTTDINVILNNLHINIVSGIAGDYPESTNYARINNTVKFTGILYPPTGDTVINLATTVYPVGDNNFNDDVQPCFTDYVKYTSTTERRSTTNPRGHALGPYCYELPEKISFCSGGLSVGDEYYNLKITSLEELYDKKESCCPHYYCGCAGLTQEFGAFSRLGLCDAVGSSGGILTHLTEDSSYYNEMTRLGLTAVADFDPVLTVNNAALTLPSGEASGLCSCLAAWVGAATWQIVRSYPCCDQPSNVKCPAIITSSLTGGCDEYDSNYVTVEQAFNDDGTLAFGSNPYTFYGEVFFENDDSMIESDIYWTATLGWYPTYASGTRPSGFFTDPNCIIDDIPSWSITDSGIITCSTASSASFGLYMSGEYMSLSMTLVGDCTGCFVLNEPLCGLGGSIVYS